MFVRRAYLNHGNIHGGNSHADEFLGFAQVYGDVVCPAVLGGFAHIMAYEERFQLEYAFEFLFGIRGASFRVEVLQFDVFDFPGTSACAKCLNQSLRCAGNAVDVNAVSRFHNFDSFFE